MLIALNFQKKVHKANKSRNISPVTKIVPKYYPVPKSVNLSVLDNLTKISPIKYLDTEILISKKLKKLASPAMKEYLCATKFSEKLEHKKIENIEAFFVVKAI